MLTHSSMNYEDANEPSVLKSPLMLTERIQQALRAAGLDGWLFFDHHRRDPLAYR
jgi:hypothetical protein